MALVGVCFALVFVGDGILLGGAGDWALMSTFRRSRLSLVMSCASC